MRGAVLFVLILVVGVLAITLGIPAIQAMVHLMGGTGFAIVTGAVTTTIIGGFFAAATARIPSRDGGILVKLPYGIVTAIFWCISLVLWASFIARL